MNIQNLHLYLQADFFFFFKSDSTDEIGGLSKNKNKKTKLQGGINVINNDNYATKRVIFHIYTHTQITDLECKTQFKKAYVVEVRFLLGNNVCQI